MPTTQSFARASYFVDPHYDCESSLIAVGVLESEDGVILVDPGPEVSLGGLQEGLAKQGITKDDIRHIFLTHIHLDHAGAVGYLASRDSRIQVHVHEIGAPHLADPSRLLASARRIYGDELQNKWGMMAAVPSDQLNVVTDQDIINLGNRSFHVIYTPGHAKHHISFVDDQSGYAFVGDVAGQKTAGVPFIMPVTPPPDVDLPAWSASLDKLEDLSPSGLFLTHFGPTCQPVGHIETMRDKLNSWSESVRNDLEKNQTDEELSETFAQEKLSNMEQAISSEDYRPYKLFAHPAGSWHGLARYWRSM